MSAGFFAPEMLPFAVALGLMLLIAALEIVGLLFGQSPSRPWTRYCPTTTRMWTGTARRMGQTGSCPGWAWAGCRC